MADLKIFVFLLSAAVHRSTAAPPASGCNYGTIAYVPHETDCQKFYQCAVSRWVEQSCGPGTVFNPLALVCDWPSNVNCPTQDTTAQVPCSQNPCLNGGTCYENGNSFNCQCMPNYTGTTCETSQYTGGSGICTHGDKIAANDGQCRVFRYCAGGVWEDYRCPTNYEFNPSRKDCFPIGTFPCDYRDQPNPSGTCTHGDKMAANDGQCRVFKYCVGGVWENYRCPTNTEFNPSRKDCFPIGSFPCENTVTGACSSNPCLNDGTCQNTGTLTYSCQCTANFQGTNCETYVLNPSDPSGYCNMNEPKTASSNDCSKFYSCVNNQWEEFRCPKETPVYNTLTQSCDYIYNAECGNRPTICNHDDRIHGNDIFCKHFYRCVNNKWQEYTCPANATFDRDEKECSFKASCPTAPSSNPCSSYPCVNGGICEVFGSSFMCLCPVGVSGSTCQNGQVSYFPCQSAPCQNGGICQDTGNNNFYCQCQSQYTGSYCQTRVSPPPNSACSSYPCQNGGTCNGVGDNYYWCGCTPGYSGANCQFRQQSCSSGPCHNGGICYDSDGGHSCSCQSNFGGVNCELSIVVHGGWSPWVTDTTPHSPCDKVCGGGRVQYTRRRTCTNPPPSNGGQPCNGDNVDTFHVACNTEPCPCSSNPCNGQACIDVSTTDFTCRCPPYKTGYQCETGCTYPCPPNLAMVYPDISNTTNFVACIDQTLTIYPCPTGRRYSHQKNDCI